MPSRYFKNSEAYKYIMNSKAFTLLGLLFTLVLIPFTVTADQKSDEALVNEATKETNPEQVYDTKQGGGGYCRRCCWIHGNRYCGKRCCSPVQEEENMVNEANVNEANLQGYGGGWGGRGWGGGWGGRGWGGGWGGRGWGGGWGGPGWGGGWGRRGWGGGWGGPGWGGGWGRRGGWNGVVEEETD